jgi:hypothetical protein
MAARAISSCLETFWSPESAEISCCLSQSIALKISS